MSALSDLWQRFENWRTLPERRFGDPGWLTRDDTDPPTYGARAVTRLSAMQLSAVWACVRLLSNTIATLPTDIVVKLGGARFPEFQKPSWLVSPNPADPSLTSTEYFAQLTTALLLDGNFFVYLPSSVLDPSVAIPLDPGTVVVKSENGAPVYEIRNNYGQVIRSVGPMNMLHGSLLRMPGALRGMSPIEAARVMLGAGMATDQFAARYFTHGSALSFGVEVPGNLTDPQKKELRQALRENYAGLANSHSVGVLTAGAKFITGLGVTNDQAQFLETRKFTVEEIARLFGVPPHMIGSQEPGASSYNSVEQRSLEFRTYSVLGLVRRIEDPHQRLVEVPVNLAGGTASAQFQMNLDGLARADLKTRFDAYSAGVTGGIIKPDEARSWEDLPPVPGGNVTYMQSQYVPLGTAPVAPVPAAEPAPARSEVPSITVNAPPVSMTIADGAIRNSQPVTVGRDIQYDPPDFANLLAALAEQHRERMEAQEASFRALVTAQEDARLADKAEMRELLDAQNRQIAEAARPRRTVKRVERGPDDRIIRVVEEEAVA